MRALIIIFLIIRYLDIPILYITEISKNTIFLLSVYYVKKR
nr:MAG TPA: hypothetical protein [Caudoviricetes sp.]